VAPPPAPVRIEAAPPTLAPPAPPAPAAPPVRVAPKLDFRACEKPSYPRNARRSQAEGDTVISYTMDTTGVISEAKIERSSGMTREHRELDRAALEAVLACKGTPGSLGGKPEKLSGTITYGWKLTD
jgi:protein TonB